MRLAEGVASWLPSTLVREPILTQLSMAAIAVCVAALIVWLTLIVLRVQSHRTKAVLWLTVLIVPMLSLVMLNLPSLFTLEMTAQVEALPVMQSGLPIVREVEEILPQALPDSGEVFFVDASALGASESTTANEEPTHSAIPTIPVPLAITITWAAIVCFFIGRLMLDSLKRLRIQRRACAPNAEVTQRWEAQLTRLGLSQRKAPRLLVTTNLESPALLGCIRPTILIPTWLAEREDPNALEWAMRHELTHWKHNDHWANAVRRLAEALFFFHPIVWWASRRWDTSAELACDRSVIASEAEAEQYTGELYTMFTMIQSRRKMRLACGLFATRIQIADRIKALTTNPLRISGSLTLTGWLASLLILATAFTASAISIEFTQPETDPPVASTQPAPYPVNEPSAVATADTTPAPVLELDAVESPSVPTEIYESIPLAAEAELSVIEEESPVAPQVIPKHELETAANLEQTANQETVPILEAEPEAQPSPFTKQAPPIAATEPNEVAAADTPWAAYTIESKIIRIPKDGKKPVEIRIDSKIEGVGYSETFGSTWTPSPSSEYIGQTNAIMIANLVDGFSYKHKVRGEVLSAPRVTIAPKSPDTFFKVLMVNPDTISGGGFGTGSPTTPTFPDPDEDILRGLERMGLPPEIVKLVGDNPDSSAVVVDIVWNDDKTVFEKGIVLALAISPDPASDAVQLNVATHYRMDDYTMQRKRAFGRLKRVYAGIVDIQMNHQETLLPDETLALVRFMPYSGDALITVKKVLVMGSKYSKESPDDQAKVFEELLDRPVTIHFEDIHLSVIVEFLSKTYGLNIVVDQRVVQPENPSEIDPGATYTTDGVIGFINLKSVKLREALKAIVRPLNLSYSIQPGFIWISIPENLKHETFEDIETRYYELPAGEIQNVNADLDGEELEPIYILNLLRHIVPDLVEPTTERRITHMNFIRETNILVVHTTPENHRKIEEMLALIE